MRLSSASAHLPDGADLSMFFSEQPDLSEDDPYGEAMGETLGYWLRLPRGIGQQDRPRAHAAIGR